MMYKIINGKELYETSTEMVVYRGKDRQDCIEMQKFLNKGGGFNGFTPTFLINWNLIERTKAISHK